MSLPRVLEVPFLRVAFPARRNKSSRKARDFLVLGEGEGRNKGGEEPKDGERQGGESGESWCSTRVGSPGQAQHQPLKAEGCESVCSHGAPSQTDSRGP